MTKSIDLSDNISAKAKKLCAESEKKEIREFPPKVVALLEEALADSPGSVTVAEKLSRAYCNNGSPGKAIKLLESTLAASGDNTRLHHALANAYADRKWGKKAIAQYTKCTDRDDLYPEFIQDFSEFMLDCGEHRILMEKLAELSEKASAPFNSKLAAVCIAMLYSSMGDCAQHDIKTPYTADFLAGYIKAHPQASNKGFFISIIEYLSQTPNDASIRKFSEKLFTTMTDAVPSAASDQKFLGAVAEFEISLILFQENVTPLTILAMRTAKLRFASANDDKDNLRYLVFDAKMAIVDVLRSSSLEYKDFPEKYPFLWTLISGFVLGALNTRDLKNFAREQIYSDLKNASPRLMKILENNIKPDSFAALSRFITARTDAVAKKTASAATAVSSKVSPNTPCPCGSGKKYKKCCGLN